MSLKTRMIFVSSYMAVSIELLRGQFMPEAGRENEGGGKVGVGSEFHLFLVLSHGLVVSGA